MTGGFNVGRDLSMICVIGIFCFREHALERRSIGPGLDLRYHILGIKRRLYHHAGKLPAEGKRNDCGPVLSRDPGLVTSGQGGLDDAIRKNPELQKTIVSRGQVWSRRTPFRHQTRTNFGLIPGVLFAYHLDCMLRRGATLNGRTRICASHFHAHCGRIVIERGVIFGFKCRPWFAGFIRLAEAVSSAAPPNLHGGDHIDFGEMLSSDSRPSSEAHSLSCSLKRLGNFGCITRSRRNLGGTDSLGFCGSTCFGGVPLCIGSLESKCRKRCDHQHSCRQHFCHFCSRWHAASLFKLPGLRLTNIV